MRFYWYTIRLHNAARAADQERGIHQSLIVIYSAAQFSLCRAKNKNAKNDPATSTRRIHSAVHRAQFRRWMIMCMCEGGCFFFSRGAPWCVRHAQVGQSRTPHCAVPPATAAGYFPNAGLKRILFYLSVTFSSDDQISFFLSNSQKGNTIKWKRYINRNFLFNPDSIHFYSFSRQVIRILIKTVHFFLSQR